MRKTVMRTAGIWVEEGHVLLESLADREVWGIPGGGLEADESAEAGCLREYQEETGMAMETLGLALLHENFWSFDGTRLREYCFYFWVRPCDPTLRRPAPVASCEPQLQFRWFPIAEVERLEFVPVFLKKALPGLGRETVFASTREVGCENVLAAE